MLNLILTLIGLSIFGAALIAGMGYIKPDTLMEASDELELQSAMSSVSSDIAQYRMLEERVPTDFQDLYNKGYMKGRNEGGSIVYQPELPWETISWPASNQISFNSGRLYVCFGGLTVSNKGRNKLQAFKNNNPDRVSIGENCHITSDEPIESTSPAEIWLTYRLN